MLDVLVAGNGIGLTATTLSQLDGVSIDAYEFNHTLDRVLEMLPRETLRFASNPRVNVLWHDGRTGIALSNEKYDLGVSAPLSPAK